MRQPRRNDDVAAAFHPREPPRGSELALVEKPVEGNRGGPGLAEAAERRARLRVVVLGERLVAELVHGGRPQRGGHGVLARPVECPGEQPCLLYTSPSP